MAVVVSGNFLNRKRAKFYQFSLLDLFVLMEFVCYLVNSIGFGISLNFHINSVVSVCLFIFSFQIISVL